MYRKIFNSLAYRLPLLYKRLLGLKRKLQKRPLTPKQHWDINLMIISGKDNLVFLQECLRSVYKTFSHLPHVHVFTDTRLPVAECRSALAWFPADRLTFISAEENTRHYQVRGDERMVTFIKTNVLGPKLAAILRLAEEKKPFLYCDTDVLWFRDPFELIEHLRTAPLSMHLSYDFQPAYDLHLVENAGLVQLKEAPFYCTGIMLINAIDDEARAIAGHLLGCTSEVSDHFTEQTIMAVLQKRAGIPGLSAEDFAIILDDNYALFPQRGRKLYARHYVGQVRHLFWRDAWFMQ